MKGNSLQLLKQSKANDVSPSHRFAVWVRVLDVSTIIFSVPRLPLSAPVVRYFLAQDIQWNLRTGLIGIASSSLVCYPLSFRVWYQQVQLQQGKNVHPFISHLLSTVHIHNHLMPQHQQSCRPRESGCHWAKHRNISDESQRPGSRFKEVDWFEGWSTHQQPREWHQRRVAAYNRQIETRRVWGLDVLHRSTTFPRQVIDAAERENVNSFNFSFLFRFNLKRPPLRVSVWNFLPTSMSSHWRNETLPAKWNPYRRTGQ